MFVDGAIKDIAGKVVNYWFHIILDMIKVLIKVKYSKSVIHTDNSRVTTTKNHRIMYNTKSNKIKIIKQK